LRGITLYGINSVTQVKAVRIEAWDHLAKLCKPQQLLEIAKEISLEEAIQASSDLIDGKIRGRVIVDVNR
jgi:acrylyl-CoA reductase (NADPH)